MAWRWKESLLLTWRRRGSSLNRVIWLRSVAADPDAFQQLSDAELATLGQLGVRRAVAAGEYLYRESDPATISTSSFPAPSRSSSTPRVRSGSSPATEPAGSLAS